MQFVPGPDFPTAGVHHRPRGHPPRLRDRPRADHPARAHARSRSTRRATARRIIVTEIPYQVNKARLIEKIAELVREKKLEGISDIRDESDRAGHAHRHRAQARRHLRRWCSTTSSRMTAAARPRSASVMLAIDGGQPRTLTLKEMLERFIAHRRDVVTRRSRFELRKARGAPAHRRGPARRAGHHRPGDHHHPRARRIRTRRAGA